MHTGWRRSRYPPPATGFQLVKAPEWSVLRIADLVDDEPTKRDRVSNSLKDPAQKNNRDHVVIIIALGMAKEGLDWIGCEHALTVGYRASLTATAPDAVERHLREPAAPVALRAHRALR